MRKIENQISQTTPAVQPAPEDSPTDRYRRMIKEIGEPPTREGRSLAEYTRLMGDWNADKAKWQEQNGKVEMPNNKGKSTSTPISTLQGPLRGLDRIDDFKNRTDFSTLHPDREVKNGGARSFNLERVQRRLEEHFPQEHFHDGKVTERHTGVFGDGRGAFGRLNRVFGKFAADLVIQLDEVCGDVSDKHDLCHLLGNISNACGNLLTVDGKANGLLRPYDVTNLGDRERINLILKGYFEVSSEGKAAFTEKDLNEEIAGTLVAKEVSFRRLYETAEKYLLAGDQYTNVVKELFDVAFVKLKEVWPLTKPFRCNLSGGTTAPFLENDPELEKELHDKYRDEIFAVRKNNGDPEPTAGPARVVYHPPLNSNGKPAYSHIEYVFADLDGRSEASKNFRLPREPIIRETSDDIFEARRYYASGCKFIKEHIVEKNGWLLAVPYFQKVGKIRTIKRPLPKAIEILSSAEEAKLARILSPEAMARVRKEAAKPKTIPEEAPKEITSEYEAMRRPLPSQEEAFVEGTMAATKVEKQRGIFHRLLNTDVEFHL